MNEKHVVSLSLAKKLKETRYPQQGEFWWKIGDSSNVSLVKEKDTILCKYIVAPLASELMERLPEYLKCWSPLAQLTIVVIEKHYRVAYVEKELGIVAYEGQRIVFDDVIFCNVLAKMYIYLTEKGLLKGEQK